jgi:hypothetical protein
MLLQRTNLGRSNEEEKTAPSSPSRPEDPLICMMYFFASQMGRNLQSTPQSSIDRSGQLSTTTLVHRLDTLLARVGIHASFSPLITQFETFPVEISEVHAQSRWRTNPPKNSIHDTMLLVKFRSKRAREEWIETREWREFMQKTEAEGVFRRIPHVRCARSLKGLKDPIEVLSV